MRPPWSSMLAVVAAATLLQADAAAAVGPADTVPALVVSDTNDVGFSATLLAAAADAGEQAWLQLRRWIAENYARAPALMLGLSVLLAVPPLALAGLLVRRKRPAPDATVRIKRSSRRSKERPRFTTARLELSPWPTEAWVEVEGIPGKRWVIGRTLVRIGREGDNEICLSAHTVHRYHAVIRRTTEGEVVITDLSGSDGNGVLVNGARAAEARLTNGDTIRVGEVKLRFDSSPVP